VVVLAAIAAEGPRYRRRETAQLLQRLRRPRGLIEIIRGPRQVGKTTAIEQTVEDLLAAGVRPRDILLARFDQAVLRSAPRALLSIVRWFQSEIRKRPFGRGRRSYIFLDEIQKLPRWDEDTKHLIDTFPIRLVLTGSSSVLVSRGGRESLAGRALTTDLPTFLFREVLEAWKPIAGRLPERRRIAELLTRAPTDVLAGVHGLRGQQKASLRRSLETYYNRGGYPRLYNGEVDEDRWADYVHQTIVDRVLGVDVPDLFPVQNPQLLRWCYVELARRTGQEVAQSALAKTANAAEFQTSQPVVRRYIQYLADALLIREFRRYPLARKRSVRTPSKFTLTDLGARNALFRGAPSLWDSPPEIVGPLVETLVQGVIQAPTLQVHFFRDHETPGLRRSPLREVDFVMEDQIGTVIPIEVKFRRSIRSEDFAGLTTFLDRFKADHGIMITRDTWKWHPGRRVLCVPLVEFLTAF
jgi:predicted AAA+ superfamily ATPase